MSEFNEKSYQEQLDAIDKGGQAGRSVKQFVSFRVGTEDYAVDILAVREIKGWTNTTALPNQPEYVRGVLNLRGAIVPVFDLSCRFNKGMTKATSKHVVIIVAIGNRLIGLLVDMVSDILSVTENEIGPVPETEAADKTRFLSGIIAVNDQMVVILSLETLFESIHPATDTSAASQAA